MKIDNLDEVVFDYLEGNLLPEEKEAFELVMSEREVVSHEVKLWKNAYVTAEFNDVDALEARLIQPITSTPLKHSIFNRTLTILLLLSLGIVIGHQIKQTPGVHISNPINIPSVSPVVECIPTVNTDVVVADKHFIPVRISTEQHPVRVQAVEKDLTSNPNFSTRQLIPAFTIDKSLERVELVRVLEQRKSYSKKFSAKETRSINRKKRKDYEQKLQAEFQKGNEPYVVPLKSNNF